jgi:hypothetical protein
MCFKWEPPIEKLRNKLKSQKCFESSFQNCFWNLWKMFGSSQFWKIRIAWNLQNAKLKNYSDNMLWYNFLEFKKTILEMKSSNKFTNANQKNHVCFGFMRASVLVDCRASQLEHFQCFWKIYWRLSQWYALSIRKQQKKVIYCRPV